MSEEKVVNYTEDDYDLEDNSKRVSYVSKDLLQMIQFVAKIYDRLGHTDYHKNTAIAAVNGVKAVSIKMHLSSAQQYNLLELKRKEGYKVTDHFKRLYLWKSSDERTAAAIESLRNPSTYKVLFKDYEYNTVPFEGVKNHLIKTFDMVPDAAAKAAEVFIKNLRDFGLLDNRGVLITALPAKNEDSDDKPQLQDVDDADNLKPVYLNTIEKLIPPTNNPRSIILHCETDANKMKTVPIHLIDSKQAWLVYPDDMTEDDIVIISHQVEGVLMRIKLEAKRKGAETPSK